MRAAFLAIVALIAFALGMQPAGAVVVPVEGPFTGSAPFEIGAGCAVIRQSFVGSAELSTLGSSTVALDFCVTFEIDVVPASGPFTITAAEGDVVGIVASGAIDEFAPPPAPVHLNLEVTGGSDRFAGATGMLAFDGAFTPAEPMTAELSGTIDFGPSNPDSRTDCVNGGWRNVGDDNGVAFRNQGQCVNYVVHHD